MRFVIQVVTKGSVSIAGKQTAEIGKGFVVLIGISQADLDSGQAEVIAEKMTKKMLGLRIFSDAEGKTNLSLADVEGALLLVSQFTLYADCRKGNRPSFVHAGAPGPAEAIYQQIVTQCRSQVPVVQTGVFGAEMMVSLVNDGPFTIVLDSDELF